MKSRERRLTNLTMRSLGVEKEFGFRDSPTKKKNIKQYFLYILVLSNTKLKL